jgi:hypothetical protein
MSNDLISKINDVDLPAIQKALEEALQHSNRITSGDFYNKIGKDLQIQLVKSVFCPSLTANIAAGRISGFYCRKGKAGGIFRGTRPEKAAPAPKPVAKPLVPQPEPPMADSEPPPPTEPKPYLQAHIQLKPAPKAPLVNFLYDEKENFFIFINEEQYRVPCNKIYVKSLLEDVFKAKEDPSGNIKLLDKTYSIPDIKPDGTKMFENFLYYFLNAAICHTGKDMKYDSPRNV